MTWELWQLAFTLLGAGRFAMALAGVLAAGYLLSPSMEFDMTEQRLAAGVWVISATFGGADRVRSDLGCAARMAMEVQGESARCHT